MLDPMTPERLDEMADNMLRKSPLAATSLTTALKQAAAAWREERNAVYALGCLPVEQYQHIPLPDFVSTRFVRIDGPDGFNEAMDAAIRERDEARAERDGAIARIRETWDAKEAELEAYRQADCTAKHQLREARARIEELERRIAERDRAYEQRRQAIRERDSKHGLIIELQARIDNLVRERDELLDERAMLRASIDEADDRIILRERERDEWKRLAESERCDECHCELTACGEYTADGPTLDCPLCKLRARIAELESMVEARSDYGELLDRCADLEGRIHRLDAAMRAAESLMDCGDEPCPCCILREAREADGGTLALDAALSDDEVCNVQDLIDLADDCDRWENCKENAIPFDDLAAALRLSAKTIKSLLERIKCDG